MRIIRIEGCTVALDVIATRSRRRRENELAAVGELLAAVAGRPVEILHHKDGSPYPAGLPLHISISHSQHLAALLWSENPGYGVDVEENRTQQLERVAPRVMSVDELEYYGRLTHGLLRAWTLKEAAFKAAGMADVANLSEIMLPLDDGEDIITLRGLSLQIVYSREVEDRGHTAYLSVVRLR